MRTPLCVRCGAWMTCAKTGQRAWVDADNVLAGDLFECHICGNAVVANWAWEAYPGGTIRDGDIVSLDLVR